MATTRNALQAVRGRQIEYMLLSLVLECTRLRLTHLENDKSSVSI